MDNKSPGEGLHQLTEFDLLMKKEGENINPETAEVTRSYRDWPDVYATGNGGIGSIYMAYFARNPDGPWVCSEDIPSEIWKQIMEKPRFLEDKMWF